MDIERAKNIMIGRGQRFLSAYEHFTKVRLSGPIDFNAKNNRYAAVHADPEYLFSVPGSNFNGCAPRYLFWLGEREGDVRRVMGAFYFALSHEAMHVIIDARFPLHTFQDFAFQGIGFKPIDEYSHLCAMEMIVDRGTLKLAVRTGRKLALISSMVGFSSMVLEDYREGGLEILHFSSAAREMAKLRWVQLNAGLPLWLRDQAGSLSNHYIKSMRERNPQFEQAHPGIAQLTQVYLQIFSEINCNILENL